MRINGVPSTASLSLPAQETGLAVKESAALCPPTWISSIASPASNASVDTLARPITRQPSSTTRVLKAQPLHHGTLDQVVLAWWRRHGTGGGLLSSPRRGGGRPHHFVRGWHCTPGRPNDPNVPRFHGEQAASSAWMISSIGWMAPWWISIPDDTRRCRQNRR